jgi:hypothetical protein
MMADIKFEKYLIIYSDDALFYTDNSVSINDCLIQFLDYTGYNLPLIRKALNAMETDEEAIELIEKMTGEIIRAFYRLDKVIYKENTQ